MRAMTMIAVAAATALAAPAGAATFTYSAEITLDPNMVKPNGDFAAVLPGTPFLLNTEDEVVGSIRFADGARLTIFEKPGQLGEELISLSFGSGGTTQSFFKLTGIQGNYIGAAEHTSYCSAQCFSTFGDLTSSSFSFTGVDFRMTLLGAPTTFDPHSISVFRGIVSVPEQTGAVPEPGTWAMMIAGFGLVGGTMRRRRGLGSLAAA